MFILPRSIGPLLAQKRNVRDYVESYIFHICVTFVIVNYLLATLWIRHCGQNKKAQLYQIRMINVDVNETFQMFNCDKSTI